MKFAFPPLSNILPMTVVAVFPLGVFAWIVTMICNGWVDLSAGYLLAVCLGAVITLGMAGLLLSGWFERKAYRLDEQGIRITRLWPLRRNGSNLIPWSEVTGITIKSASAPKSGWSYYVQFGTSRGESFDLANFKNEENALQQKQDIEKLRGDQSHHP